MTASSPEEAEFISGALLEKNLVACANIFPAHKAVFRWNGALQTAQETAVFFKTRAELFPALEAEIRRIHSYECPCIVALPIETGHAPFLEWVAAETQKADVVL
ncbi:MAG: divalent-cation tolerance protein CutA [Alphaproteobacteria bacterium]|nr:divalent-cation tolerance protein CutA [Alphaproteobacteria bacterium]